MHDCVRTGTYLPQASASVDLVEQTGRGTAKQGAPTSSILPPLTTVPPP
jgi:hypothetical protein